MAKIFKKFLMLLTIISLLSSMLVGCKSNKADDASAPSADNKTNTSAQSNGSKQINLLMDFNIMDGISSLTDNKYVDFLEKKTGVRIVMTSPGPAAYNDKLNIMMASGNPPDAFMAGSRDQIMKYALDDLLTDISPYIKDSAKYPNIVQHMPKDAWPPVTQDGKVYAFPYSRFDALHQSVFVRKQWMQKLNLQVPKTIDDYYNVMKAFTFNDPDGNGEDDTFGLLANDSLGNGARIFRTAFDADCYKIVDGKVTPPQITNEYKEYLKFLNKLVKEKIMDPEFPNCIVQVYMDKLKTYKYGMTSYFWHANQLPEYNENKVHENWDSIDLPVKKDGSPSKFYATSLNRHYIGIPKKSKNVDTIMKFFDWVCSAEGKKWLYLGVEGDEYKIENGKVQVLKQRNSLHWMFSMVSPGEFDDEVKSYLALTYPKETVDRLDLSVKNGTLDKLNASLPYYPDLSQFNLSKVIDEFTVKAVLGNTDIDKGWDEYVTKWKAAGGEKAMKFWTDWYNKSGKDIIK